MFAAILLVCALSTPTECVRFDDTRGPYATLPECEARIHEMAAEVARMFPVPATYRYKCKELTQT
jgi:hypothetical protein